MTPCQSVCSTQKCPERQRLNETVHGQGCTVSDNVGESKYDVRCFASHNLGTFMLKINHIITPDMKQNNHELLSQRNSFIWANLNVLRSK